MKAIFHNIQGFRGLYSFTIGSNVTNITAKLNGTGKTTFFDCLKLLCMPSLFLEEDLKFMVNKNCKSCKFTLECDDVTYGFFYDRKRLVYTRQFNGEPETGSYSPFPDVSAKIGVYIVDDTIVNVCDKELNLFSSSNEQLNFKLIDVLTNHSKLNNMLTLAESSIEVNKNHYQTIVHQLKYTNDQLVRTTHFTNIDNFRSLLNDTKYIFTHDTLVDILEEVKLYTPNVRLIAYLDFAFINELMLDISAYKPTHRMVDETLSNPLLVLSSIVDEVACFNPTQKTIEFLPISDLYSISEALAQHKFIVDVGIMTDLADLLEAINGYTIVTQVWSHESIITLRTLVYNIEEYFSNLKKIENYETWIKRIRNSLVDSRIDCPIHREVYLVGGECRHV